MREILYADVVSAIERLCIQANTLLPRDVASALCDARGGTTAPAEGLALDVILENAALSRESGVPLCQDTGLVTVFADIGDVRIVGGTLSDAVNEGVRNAYSAHHYRNSVVRDPLYDRVNTRDNTPAILHTACVGGGSLTLTVMPKGCGAENMSRVAMLTPADGEQGVIDAVVETVRVAGGNPCPPVVIGVGLGGNLEYAPYLAKRALLRGVGTRHDDPRYAALEAELLRRVNALGVGANGWGGRATALGVHIATHPTHIAALPVAVALSCHSCRHATAVL